MLRRISIARMRLSRAVDSHAIMFVEDDPVTGEDVAGAIAAVICASFGEDAAAPALERIARLIDRLKQDRWSAGYGQAPESGHADRGPTS